LKKVCYDIFYLIERLQMKQYESGRKLNEKIMNGVNKLADAVGATLGPRGRNVIIKGKDTKPLITKDGVTVAKFVDFDDPFENLGAQVIKQASEETNTSAGDGTTTSTMLARAILEKSQSHLVAGVSPIEIKRGIDLAVTQLVTDLRDKTKPVSTKEEIEQVATISANGDKGIGALIGNAVDAVGKDGAISIQEAKSNETSLELSEGFRFDSGLLANAFITDERRGSMRHDDCLILVTDKAITTIDEILPILEIAARDGRSFIIVAEDISGQALAAMIMNSMKGTMKVAGIKAPRYGEERRNILSDLSISVGATFVSRESGIQLRNVKLSDLGTAKTVESSKFFTTIVGGNQDDNAVEKRIASLKQDIEQEESISQCEKIQERVTRLASAVAIIKVGGATEVEMMERKHRIEDALEAVNSALEEGIIAGGSATLLRVAKSLEVEVENSEQAVGVEIVKQATKDPFRRMLQNAGLSADIFVEKVANHKNTESGLNVATGEIVNMFTYGIIDPFKVLRCALQNAASAASTLLLTDHAIVEENKK
jgi:chaperonin GroEL